MAARWLLPVIVVIVAISSVLSYALLSQTSLPSPILPPPSESPGSEVEVIARNLEVPWSIAFVPDGRIFFTERVGRIRMIENGVLKSEPMAEIAVAVVGEAGLLGITLDPDFAQNRYVYVYYTYRDSAGQLWNRVVRLTEVNEHLTDAKIILDYIPAASIHDGGRVKFGPDGKLYITTGDAARPELSQNLSSLAGKVLRVNPDGSIPADNPFQGSPVYTLGHRNPQGIDWHPVTGKPFVTEHGPSAHDEVNILDPGANYGWPVVAGKAGDPRYVDPLTESGSETWAPSGAAFYRDGQAADWRHDLFFATLRGNHLRRIVLEPPGYDRVESASAMFQGRFGRLRDAVQGPDGSLYIATSNRDGRGSPSSEDDRIIRIKAAS